MDQEAVERKQPTGRSDRTGSEFHRCPDGDTPPPLSERTPITRRTRNVALIPGGIFRRLLTKEPVRRDLTGKILSTLVFRLMAALEEAHSAKVNQCLANYRLIHGSAAGELPRTQQQIAGHLGTTREMVANLVREFAIPGPIETRRGLTRILDRQGLASMIADT